ncbi:serine/threonine-protein kinase ULK3 isoform X8 [Canis lupus familiaris]|uniref:serine/threonine-protein kinase ULK3 isoform X8 n=1 Tax=Canis lupus familiaris TaxID=9615 RepID=UPI0015F1B4AC|nr:serine/threonine-protein kinase ULK3 isoform X8 [Canis lupus familiaris]XP_038317472.1 serine/threonine-protein kinase ULK3 isoform X8 [Canis lupus familiaris]XP_038436938.1 serine/threonine-protein kinase ULK3 isoform X8 [Canis lupus familiaris]
MAGPGWGPPRLDGFILTERLGSGTYATVYKAYAKKDTREVVAIKCVAKKSLNKASVENLLTEIEILKGIRHPHIVQLRDFQLPSACRAVGQRPHLPHHGVLRRGRPVPLHPHPQASAREGGSRLHAAVGALQFLHEQNISHLDLKPQNILLSSLEKPHLKLADFGFAQHMSPWDEKHVLRGSPLYMAPEMVCQRQYDARVDLWSVGVILYEALFGQPPFASRSFTELEEKIRSNRVIELPLRPPLSRDCRDLLQRLLERDPNRRISFQDFFAHPWVDLEHMPSGESLARATALVVQAVKKDQDGDAAAALSLYCKALDFFVPALHYEVDAQRKEAIKAKVGQYVSRAEELKAIVSSSNQALLRQGTSAQDLLREMARDKPRLLAALEVASAAMAKEEEAGGEQDALDLYQRALGELLVLLAAEPTGRRRELLHTEVQNLMARAEYLKEQVKAVTHSGSARWGLGPPGCPSPLGRLYVPQMRESRWAAETLDKEGLSESVRTSCTLQ